MGGGFSKNNFTSLVVRDDPADEAAVGLVGVKQSMPKIIERTNPLQCRKCTGTVLPDQGVCLPNGVWVLRYICIYCGCRWHAVKRARQWVLVKATSPVLRVTSVDSAGIPSDGDDAIAA